MRNLLNFLIRYSTYFLFALYVLLSCILLFSHSNYQQSVYLTSANAVCSSIFKTSASVTGYFNLRQINRELQESNAALQNEVLNLRDMIADYQTEVGDSSNISKEIRFNYRTATVINNSIRHPRNYFTINKGTEDGVGRGMGVMDQNGIVGIVDVVGKHTARLISVLNESQHFSVKLKDTPFVGTLSWRGGDPAVAYMEEVPRHARYSIGDTIVTSGYSSTFPANIPVGTVMARVKSTDDNYFVLKVHLASDFRNLSTVRVIKDELKHELDSLQMSESKVNDHKAVAGTENAKEMEKMEL